jgi:steroid delta-isomerase-like uncharacterized protein
MSLEQNKSIVRRWIEEGWSQGHEQDLVEEVFAASCLLHESSTDLHGIEALKQVVTATRLAFPDVKILIEDLIAEGNKVVARIMVHGTHQGEFLGVAATGKRVTLMDIAIFHLADGKIVETWELLDGLHTLRQLGVSSIPANG